MSSPATILIVDDEIQNRKLLEVLLVPEGYLTASAANGEEALASVAEHAPDLILLDILMPGMDGYQVARTLKANPASSNIPIIMLTVQIDRDARLAGLNAGAEEFLTKPVDRDELSLRVRNLLRLKALGDFFRNHTSLLEREVQTRTERLQASELRFRQMAENIREVFWLTDPAKNEMLYVSPAYAEIWGRSCESLYASPREWVDAIHPEDRERVQQAARSKQASGKYVEEYRVVRPDGAIRWIRDRAFPVFRNEREVYRIAGLAEDITDRKQAAEELHRSESIKGAILESSLDCLIAVDHEGRIVEFNPAAEATFGVTREQALGTAMVDLIVPPRLREGHLRGFARYLATGKGTILGKRLELEAIRADGTEFPIELTIAAIGGTSTPMFTASIRDITARKEADGKIEKLSRIRAVSSEINAAIFRIRERKALLEETCRIASEKGKFEMIWIGAIDQDAQQVEAIAWKGFSEKTARAVNWANISTTKGTLDEAIRTRKPSVRNDIEGQLPGGGLRPEALDRGCRSTVCLPLVVDDKVVALIVLFAPGVGFFDEEELVLLNEVAADVSFALQAIEKQKKLDYLSYYDVLTGLANRSLFLERVAQYMRGAISAGHKLAVGLVDLERFKNINDSLGRPAGDALLKQVAEWLTRRTGDASVLARVGADHFAVVLPEVEQDGNLAGLIDGMMAAFLAHPFRLNDTVFRVALKMGVALFPDDGADADTLFKNAEAALKRAKASGDPYLFYTQTMTETVAGKLTLENQLRQALDNEEFVLHYQPKVNLASGEVTGAEALIRWNDPRTGLVPPGRFIPVLEETGLIYEVGRWALRKAVEDYLGWRAAGLAAVRISVNVSPLQLRSRGFIAEITQAIGIDAHAAAGLELEITESLVMEDIKHNIASLQAIRAMGVRIAIDDFGTGFSSLSYLAKLPVDTLKIDRSFVIDMTANADGRALVSTIINLAHSLKLRVVAEGVETEEQSRMLRLLHCDEMQGFLFGKPVPREIFETKFLARLPRRDEREAVEIHHLG